MEATKDSNGLPCGSNGTTENLFLPTGDDVVDLTQYNRRHPGFPGHAKKSSVDENRDKAAATTQKKQLVVDELGDDDRDKKNNPSSLCDDLETSLATEKDDHKPTSQLRLMLEPLLHSPNCPCKACSGMKQFLEHHGQCDEMGALKQEQDMEALKQACAQKDQMIEQLKCQVADLQSENKGLGVERDSFRLTAMKLVYSDTLKQEQDVEALKQECAQKDQLIEQLKSENTGLGAERDSFKLTAMKLVHSTQAMPSTFTTPEQTAESKCATEPTRTLSEPATNAVSDGYKVGAKEETPSNLADSLAERDGLNDERDTPVRATKGVCQGDLATEPEQSLEPKTTTEASATETDPTAENSDSKSINEQNPSNSPKMFQWRPPRIGNDYQTTIPPLHGQDNLEEEQEYGEVLWDPEKAASSPEVEAFLKSIEYHKFPIKMLELEALHNVRYNVSLVESEFIRLVNQLRDQGKDPDTDLTSEDEKHLEALLRKQRRGRKDLWKLNQVTGLGMDAVQVWYYSRQGSKQQARKRKGLIDADQPKKGTKQNRSD